MRRTPAKVILSLGLIALILINIIAYNQAHAMLNFAPAGERTKSIESLTPLEKVGLLITGVTIPKPQNEGTPADHQLEYEIHYFDSDTIQLEAWYIPAENTDATILLFHGYAGSKEGLLDEALAFHELNFDVFMVDFRGSGGSGDMKTTVGILEANDVTAAVQYVNEITPNQPVILYGRSMGAAAILRALATTDSQPDAIIIEAVFGEMLTTVKNRFHSMGVPSFPAAHVLIFWASVQNGFSGFAHNPAQYAKRVTVPTLIMHGTDDPRATFDEGQRVYAAIASPAKQFVQFDSIGHESYLNAEPDKWQTAVGDFLQPAARSRHEVGREYCCRIPTRTCQPSSCPPL